MSQESIKSRLETRAQMLSKARDFFQKRNVLEIDTGALMKRASIDTNIDCLSVEGGTAYLHTSPEYALKRLLSSGVGDCYFLGHVYRKEELGRYHNPEFTMVEWYRIGFSFSEIIQETAEFLFLFFGKLPISTISYREAFEKFVGIDPKTSSLETLQSLTREKWSEKECIHYLLSHKIEPNLGHNELTVLIDYPPDEAALAKTEIVQGERVAKRFEIYYQGIELANGYDELADAEELKKRFEKTNAQRERSGKEKYLLDEKFLTSLKVLPECSGVALGFDRALMLHMKKKSIKEVIPFDWETL